MANKIIWPEFSDLVVLIFLFNKHLPATLPSMQFYKLTISSKKTSSFIIYTKYIK